jgi:hypothetical protein
VEKYASRAEIYARLRNPIRCCSFEVMSNLMSDCRRARVAVGAGGILDLPVAEAQEQAETECDEKNEREVNLFMMTPPDDRVRAARRLNLRREAPARA